MYHIILFRKKIWMGIGSVCFAVILLLCIQPWQKEILQTNAEEGIRLPAIMYHGLLQDETLQGDYVIDPDLFESDLQYLKEKGYTPVTISELVDYIDIKKDLPKRPILLTFDDGYYNNYHYAYPLAKKYNMKIIISPIGYYTDLFSETEDVHVTYSHITWENMREMAESGLVEFQNHSYNLHSSGGKRLGTKRMSTENAEEYRSLLWEDIGSMQKKMEKQLGKKAECFTYPFGAISEGEPEILQEMGFRSTLTCESRMNVITRDPKSLYNLGRYLRPAHLSSKKFFSDIGIL